MSRASESRPHRLDHAPLDYAPDNEMGVVYLFASIAKKRFGLRVAEVRAGFPDCIAYQGEKRVRIEFEFRSRNFKTHRHDPKKCDWIVCWKHDWPEYPKRLRVVELRGEFGHGTNVWLVPVKPREGAGLDRERPTGVWSVPGSGREGDLVLYYRTSPDRCVRNLHRIVGRVGMDTRDYSGTRDRMAPIRKVCDLASPLHLSELRQHRVLKSANFVRANVRGRYSVTQHWPELYDAIVSRNPSVRRSLKAWEPGVVLG